MIYVEILKDVEVDCVSNICCVSGVCNRVKTKLKQGSKLCFNHASYSGPARQEIKHYDLIIANDRALNTHPDHLEDVPANAILFRSKVVDKLWRSDWVEKWTDAYLRLTSKDIKDEHVHYLQKDIGGYWHMRTPGHLVVVRPYGNTEIYSTPEACSIVGRGFNGWANTHFLTDVVY